MAGGPIRTRKKKNDRGIEKNKRRRKGESDRANEKGRSLLCWEKEVVRRGGSILGGRGRKEQTVIVGELERSPLPRRIPTYHAEKQGKQFIGE